MKGSIDIVSISSDPRSIWLLEESERPAAVIALLRECAQEFHDAVRRGNAGDAQDMAIHALASIAGLFPDTSDGVQSMLLSLTGVLVTAKGGGADHILLRSTRPIIGTKKGFGHANLGGFAISAVKILTDLGSMSVRQARKAVAQMLADAGCSLKKGDHEWAKPITDGAIRNWQEKPDDFPLHNAIAADMATIHAANLKARGVTTQEQILAYFRSYAAETVQRSEML